MAHARERFEFAPASSQVNGSMGDIRNVVMARLVR
jgi:hypothetical protein